MSTALQIPVARVSCSGLSANAGISAASAGRGVVAAMLISAASTTTGASGASASASAAAPLRQAAWKTQLSAIRRPRSARSIRWPTNGAATIAGRSRAAATAPTPPAPER